MKDKSILAVGAHPDDMDFTSAGTIARFIEEGANLFIIAIGYKPGGVVPILMPGMSPSWFAVNSAYPLPFGLVLTSIVIGASTLAVMLAIVMVIYKKYGTLSTKVLLADTSKQEEYDE